MQVKHPANEEYVRHRNHCDLCSDVDAGIHGARRCDEGKKKVRAAAAEGRASRMKPMITAKDFEFLRNLKISL